MTYSYANTVQHTSQLFYPQPAVILATAYQVYLGFLFQFNFTIAEIMHSIITASVVEGLESMTSNPVTSLAWVRSPGDALVV
jgi:hypothetical protein